MTGRPLLELVLERGLAPDTQTASSLIMQGRVLVGGRPETGVRKLVGRDAAITVEAEELPYVSRGALKLRNCLDALASDAPDITDSVCLDVGAGSGGFTQVLLERGARRVYAVDVGRSVKDSKLRDDPRVVLLEGVNARELRRDLVPEVVDFFTLDVSFMSGASLLSRIRPLCASEASGLFLVKPQFERELDPNDERSGAFRDGVVRSRDLLVRTLRKVFRQAIASQMVVKRVQVSEPRGTQGNYEFFFLLALAGDGMNAEAFEREVHALVKPLDLS